MKTASLASQDDIATPSSFGERGRFDEDRWSKKAMPSSSVCIDLQSLPRSSLHRSSLLRNDVENANPAFETARLNVLASLSDYDFSPTLDRAEQHRFQKEYAHYVATAILARREALGTNYEVDAHMDAPLRDGYLPALLDTFKGGTSSSFRAPFRNFMVVFFDPRRGEVTTDYDGWFIGGVFAGQVIYLAQIFLQACDRIAKRSNLGKISKVDVKALLPDPCKIELTVVDNHKIFKRHSGPAYADLKTKTLERRGALAGWQSNLEAGGIWGSHLQGVVSGVLNGTRRKMTSSSGLLNSGTVFWTSFLTSALGGAMVKGGLSIARVSPKSGQTEIDNLLGKKQRVNLFRVDAPRTGELPASIKGLLPGGLATVKETGKMLLHAADLRRGWQPMVSQAVDNFRHIAASTWASMAAGGIGSYAAQIPRPGGSILPLPGESPHSFAFLFQQFVQGLAHDFIYNTSMEGMRAAAYSIGDSLDNARRSKLARLQETSNTLCNKIATTFQGINRYWRNEDATAGATHEAGKVTQLFLAGGLNLSTVTNTLKALSELRPLRPYGSTQIDHKRELQLRRQVQNELRQLKNTLVQQQNTAHELGDRSA